MGEKGTHNNLLFVSSCRYIFDSEEWKTPISRMLRINIRTIERIANGSDPVPEWLGERVSQLSRLVADNEAAKDKAYEDWDAANKPE